GHQVRGGFPRSENLDPLAWRMRQRPAAQFERRHDLRRARESDAHDSNEIVGGAPRQPVQPAVRREQCVRDAQRVAAPGAVAYYQRDELVVAERRRAMMPQLLARPVAGQQVFHLILNACRRSVACRCRSPCSRRWRVRRAAILPTRKCSRRRARSTPRAQPAPINTPATSSPPPKTPSSAPAKPLSSATVARRSTTRSTRASAPRPPPRKRPI